MAMTELDPQAPYVFGYGSLLWRPGFDFASTEPALLRGAHRSLCLYSHRHRGTRERPGLVFGLVRGGSCRGMAFAVAPERWQEVREYLREREQASDAYKEVVRPVLLGGGRMVGALTFLVDVRHALYAGGLDIEAQLAVVRGASGESGDNVAYVVNTVDHLLKLGIQDRSLMMLRQRLVAGE
jgi:cation transport protein ChaC